MCEAKPKKPLLGHVFRSRINEFTNKVNKKQEVGAPCLTSTVAAITAEPNTIWALLYITAKAVNITIPQPRDFRHIINLFWVPGLRL